MIGDWCVRCLDFLIPLGCAGCEIPVASPALFCPHCVDQLVPFDAPVHPLTSNGPSLIAAHVYAGPVKQAIHRFKFGNRPELAGRLARHVAIALHRVPIPPSTVLVPVPLTAQRLVERGYNQAALLSGSIARQLGLDHRPRALRRISDASHQVGANKAARAQQVSGMFAADARKVANTDVVLVDDVVTTGATANACAAALTAAGARVIAVAAIARVL
jgi:ComF family protein